jgi:cytochrome c-type biogenesis protein
MEYLQKLLECSTAPLWTAMILGLMTAISPCPLATNITAMGYISSDIVYKQRVFINGLLYTLGRTFSYASLGIILYFGASRFRIAAIFQAWGEKLIGFILILIGIMMLDFIRIKFPGLNRITDKVGKAGKGSLGGAFLLGVVFALAFCPYSGMLFFGILIPLTVTSTSGLFLPLIFAVATGLPVILIAWLLAYSVSGIGSFYSKVKDFELWFRRMVALSFIIAGLYYMYIIFIQ